jgi:hypothetical protein
MQLAGIAQQLAVIYPAQAAAPIERALAVAETIPSDWLRSDVLASIAERLAGAASANPALIKQALALTIPAARQRRRALAGIVGLVPLPSRPHSRSQRALGQEPPGNPDITHDRRNDRTPVFHQVALVALEQILQGGRRAGQPRGPGPGRPQADPDRGRPHPRGQHVTIRRRNLHHSQCHEPWSRTNSRGEGSSLTER